MDFTTSRYLLRSLSLFEMLNKQEAALVRSVAVRREYKKGQVIIREGTYSKGVFIVRRGKVKIHNSSAEGKESILYIYRKDEFFGYRPLIAHETNPVSATAMESVVVNFLPAENFLKLLNESSKFALKLLESSTSEFSVWINKLTLFSQYGVRERTAMALMILATVYSNGKESPNKVNIRISRDDLSAYVGTVKETVVRMLRVFKDAGIISTRGSLIRIRKPAVLLDYIGYL